MFIEFDFFPSVKQKTIEINVDDLTVEPGAVKTIN